MTEVKIVPQIKYKSLLANIKDIGERNKAFNALTKEEQRLEIAWDALQLVITDKVKASTGCYWNWKLNDIVDGSKNAKEFQNNLLNNLPEGCLVCARGALTLSRIRLGNKVKPDDNFDNSGYNNVKGFTLEDYQKAEKEYEWSYYSHPYNNNTNQKLANILCNILVNGNFNTEDRTDYLK